MPFGIPALVTKTGNDRDLYVKSNTSGSSLNSTVLIQPAVNVGRINTNLPSAVSGSLLELGPSTTNYKAVTIYDNGSAVNGAGLNIASTEPSAGGSALNIVGPGTGTQSSVAYLRVNTSNGGERLILASNPTINNLVLSPTATIANATLATAVDVDVDNGGVYRRSNNSDNQAILVQNIQTDPGATTALVVPAPDGLIVGLYAVLTGGSVGNLAITTSGTGCLMYWNGSAWSAGGSMNNPQTGGGGATAINQYGIRATGGAGTNLTFCNGTNTLVPAGDVNVYIMLIMAGPSVGGQLAPFIAV